MTNYGTYTKKDVRAAFQCPYLFLSAMVQSPSITCLTSLNLVQQIGKSNVATSEDVEDMEDLREFRTTLA